ncbi:hypothetical protein, partial [Rhizobium sp.]|uniref:hypothetical protein n=1 Tax=Rhizobium sp. TaxID=391 RepID=UPI00289DBD73
SPEDVLASALAKKIVSENFPQGATLIETDLFKLEADGGFSKTPATKSSVYGHDGEYHVVRAHSSLGHFEITIQEGVDTKIQFVPADLRVTLLRPLEIFPGFLQFSSLRVDSTSEGIKAAGSIELTANLEFIRELKMLTNQIELGPDHGTTSNSRTPVNEPEQGE